MTTLPPSSPAPGPAHDTDPLGHALLAQRLAQVPGELAGMLVRGLPQLSVATLATERFVVTGTGSSEAHARFLCTLINLYTERAATYLPLSALAASSAGMFVDRTLVVFSQGISPNAQIAFRRRAAFAHTILFTATTAPAARVTGKPDQADLLYELVDGGGDLIVFPLAEEYTTLIRFVGPLCGYLACLQFAAQLTGCRFSPPRPDQILPLLDAAPPGDLADAILERPDSFTQGFNLVTAAPISDFAQNLACKFMEGLFWPCPPISDFLQFAHGPFQQMTARPRPVIILQGDSTVEAELVRRSVGMLHDFGLEAYVIQVDAPPLFSIFGFEAAFNRLVFAALQRFGIDQVNWPGKGRDDLLYGFSPDP
jgi:creatinine amidohydrolase